MRVGELVLLLSKGSSYLVKVKKEKLHTQEGIINLTDLLKKSYGNEIKSHLNKKFVIVKPSVLDILERKVKRTAQVILPKDIALILAYTGIGPNGLVVDAGTGTGYLAIFLANYVRHGKVVTYEKDKRFIKIAKENIRKSGLSKFIKLKQKNVTKGIDEKNVDLVTLDLKDVNKIIDKAYKSLKSGGWLVVYSPTVNELISVIKKIKRKNFCEVKTVENIVREWQIERTIRPKTMGLMHTGFLTFARKVK